MKISFRLNKKNIFVSLEINLLKSGSSLKLIVKSLYNIQNLRNLL
jgi:hypothetical protein